MVSRARALLPVLAVVIAACSDGTSERVGTSSAPMTKVCGAGTNGPVQGYDVSYYQGNFNWVGAKNGGAVFGYARISDGLGYIDPQFGNNWSNMKAAGVMRGAYQFFRPGQDATQQANMMVQKVGGMLGVGDLPAMIDVEATDGQSPGTIAAKVKTWLDIVEQGTGRRPFIYTGAYFWEDYVQSTAFGGYPLWIAAYGPVCPSVPNGWQNWTMWQYSDGNGTLDHDVFNGNLQQLEALARPPNQAPRGWLDSADCTAMAGWAQDEDTPGQAIDVHLYFDGPAGQGHGVATKAGNHRQDLCQAIGSCEHGFSLRTPASLLDGKEHPVFAYGIDTNPQGLNDLLAGAPKTFKCDTPALPTNMVRRWVTDPATFAAWRFDGFMDVVHHTDAELATVPRGLDVPHTPRLVVGDDGAPEVWLLDEVARKGEPLYVKRHVIDPDSFAAWRFDWNAIEKMAAGTLANMKHGADWPARPMVVQGDGPEVDFLDVPYDLPPVSGGPDAGGASPPGPSVGDPGSTPQQGGGCSISTSAPGSSGAPGSDPTLARMTPWLVLGLVGLARWGRVRRRCARSSSASPGASTVSSS
jgi:GH25 family lysozyme M1 (1,4-beta-N-acetylmuramidase)